MRRGRKATVALALLALVVPLVAQAQPRKQLSATQLRAAVYQTDPYLARIIDREDGRWDPTISYGGGHNPYDSYGLCQANPGTKMASAGPDWRTNVWTQLRWCRAYAISRYGSEANAWAYWQAHSGW